MTTDNEPEAAEFAAPSMEDLAPLFPAYEFEAFIAQGGMGAVYQARQKSLDRVVAIKILPREMGTDQAFRDSFEAEARAMARLNDSNLIGVYDFGEADGMLFIVMEFVQGQSLFQSAHGRAVDPAHAVPLVIGISRGLHHAHQNGILHRDVKPANILLDAQANPKIGDFGLARPMGDQTGDSRGVYGTPGYTAPEVISQETIDHRADIFSIGVILHELLTGVLPDESRTPPSVVAGSPREFDAVVSRATQPSPAMRYPSAEELANDLEQILKAQQSEATPASARFNLGPNSRTAGAPVMVKARATAPAPSGVATSQTTGGSPGSPVATPATPVVGPATALASRPAGKPAVKFAESKTSPVLIASIIGLVLAIVVIAIIATQSEEGADGDKNTKKKKTEEIIQPSSASIVPDDTTDPFAIDPDPADAPDTPVTSDPIEEKKETAVAALKRLKATLAAGTRREFPPGTVERKESHFLLLAGQPMRWREALSFAEEHGAHLAVLSTTEDRKWFQKTFPSGTSTQPIWVGAGASAFDRWQWIDETPWDAESIVAPATEKQRYLALPMKQGAALAPSPPDGEFDIALQWRKDGTNPASVEAQLKRAADSIEGQGLKAARYPVGTRTGGKSQYFYYPEATTWNRAKQIAESAGAYLAVPATPAESAWVLTTFGPLLDEGNSMWIGGSRIDSKTPWQWVTKERWNHAGFVPGHAGNEDDSLTCVRLGSVIDSTSGTPAETGWIASQETANRVQGILLEWSVKPKPAAPTVAAFDLEKWLEGVHDKMHERVEPDLKDYQEKHKSIIDQYTKSMRRLAKKTDSSLGGRRAGFVTNLVKTYVDGVEESRDIGDGLPDFAPKEFKKLESSAKDDIATLDKESGAKIASHLDFYTDGLLKKAASLATSGFTAPADTLKEKAKTLAGDTDSFLDLLGL